MTIFDKQRNRINEIIYLVSNARQKNDPKMMSDAMNELYAYWNEDLKAEADYLESLNCSYCKLHLREKIYFLKETSGYYTDVNNFNYDFVDKLVEFLRNWLVDHIQVMEKKVSDCLCKKEE